MIVRLSLAAGLVAATIALAPQLAAAAPLAPTPGASEGTLVQQAQFGYCRARRNECAARWGWRTWRYWRCVAARGCA
jgi:hypothetical protein